MKTLENNISGLVLLILFFCTFDTGLKAQQKSFFDKYQWQSDTLGRSGYRAQTNIKDMYLLLLGKQKQQVIHILGPPDFVSKFKHGYSLNYCIEGGKKNNYNSKSKENNCQGSFFSVFFKKGLVEDVFCTFDTGLKAQQKSFFDKHQWQSDTLGRSGYRAQTNIKDMYLLLLGKQKQQVIHILGPPDFVSKFKHGYSLNYCIEGGKKNNYNSKSKENNYQGSFFSVFFKKGLVEDIIIIWSGG